MKIIVAYFSVLMLVCVAQATQKTLDERKAEAEKASGGHQAELYSKLAERTVELANEEFTRGDSTQAQQTVQQILKFATKAHDVALSTRKKMKKVEIHLRETQRQLENLRRTLAVDDRAPVENVEKNLSDFRQDLLNAMFAPPKRKKHQ
ncbi:MAG: hypothetical protein ACRD4F_05420 [Candidatus Angelobacter sp.]